MIFLVISLSLCSCDTAKQRQTNHVLDAVVIPELDFRDADLWDAISFLDAMSVYPGAPSQDNTGVLHPVLEMGYTNLVAGDRFDYDELQKLPGLTVCTRNIVLRDALDITCRLAGYEYLVDRAGRVVVRKKLKCTAPPPPSSADIRREADQMLRNRQLQSRDHDIRVFYKD